MSEGKLEKMRLEAYSGPELRDDQKVGETFYALVNPESYSVELKLETQQGQGQGTSGRQQRYSYKKPEEFTFEFLFDNTGIIDGKPKNNIVDDIETLKELTIKHEGNTHEPNHLKLAWGSFLFKGRLTAMNITFKLFNPDGTPIRATVKITVKGSLEDNLRVALENNQSPDLTHIRTVNRGDNLPWMCYKIYGDPKYYIQVARMNNLINFRKLEEGSTIYFPPFSKEIK